MRIQSSKIDQVREFIRRSLTEEFSDDLFQSLASLISAIFSGCYFGLMLLPNSYSKKQYLISNNPDNYLRVYLQLFPKDFLLSLMIEKREPIQLDGLLTTEIKRKSVLYNESQKVRPVSDVCYLPLYSDSYLNGYFGIARDGEKSPVYSKEEITLIKWLIFYINDCYRKTVQSPPIDSNTAYFNRDGELLHAGDEILSIFEELFGNKEKGSQSSEQAGNQRIFQLWLCTFFDSSVYSYDLRLTSSDKDHLFVSKRLPEVFYRTYTPTAPQMQVRYVAPERKASNAVAKEVTDRFGCTKREKEIADMICVGASNNDISSMAGSCESTVKRQVYSLYEKMSVRNRTELILKLSGVIV